MSDEQSKPSLNVVGGAAPPQSAGLSFRPREGSNNADPWYAPQRDVAYIYHSMCTHASRCLSEVDWHVWLKDYLSNCEETDSDLARGLEAFAEGHTLFTGRDDITNPYDALDAVGFWDLPKPVIIAIFSCMGWVLTGTFFGAVRDVTRKGEQPPPDVRLDEIMQAAHEMVRRLRMTRWQRLKHFAASLLQRMSCKTSTPKQNS